MLSYCVKERKKTECVEPSGYKTIETKRGPRKLFWCTCVSCGIKKYQFVKNDATSTTSSKNPVKREATTTRKRK